MIQNPGTQPAQIEIRYLLPTPTPAAPIVTTYAIPANTRRSLSINDEDPALRSVEISAVITSTNGVP